MLPKVKEVVPLGWPTTFLKGNDVPLQLAKTPLKAFCGSLLGVSPVGMLCWIAPQPIRTWGGGPCTRSTGATQTSLKVAPHTPLIAVWSLGMFWVQLPVVKPGLGPGWAVLRNAAPTSGAPTS